MTDRYREALEDVIRFVEAPGPNDQKFRVEVAMRLYAMKDALASEPEPADVEGVGTESDASAAHARIGRSPGQPAPSAPSPEPGLVVPVESKPRTFTMYRRGDLSATHDENQANAPDEPQFEGVLFSDGRCAVRWLTAARSVSVWDSLDELMKVHGHPEYESELVWHDSLIAQAVPCGDERLEAAEDAIQRHVVCWGNCGSLGWTWTKYGRITHKHLCPRRVDPWCQQHPEGNCDATEARSALSQQHTTGGE